MKAKDWFIKLKTQGKITKAEFDAFVDTIPEFEVPDIVGASFEESFLTRERAKSDPELMAKIKAEVYDGIDKNINENILPLLDDYTKAELEKEKNTNERLRIAKKGITLAIEKAGKSTKEDSDKVKELTAQKEELLKKLKEVNDLTETKVKELTNSFENEKKNILLDHTLKGKVAALNFADEHTPLKEAISNVILTELKSKELLHYGENGEILVLSDKLENTNGVPKPKFNGNEQVSIDAILTEKAAPYLKRNNADVKEPTARQTQTRTVDDVSPQNMTLKDRQRAAALAKTA